MFDPNSRPVEVSLQRPPILNSERKTNFVKLFVNKHQVTVAARQVLNVGLVS